MIWIVMIVTSVLMFKLGMLTVIAGMLSVSLKAALFVIIIFVCLAVLRWFRSRGRQS